MIVLRRSMQGEDVFEHTKGKRHVFAVKYARGRYYRAFESQVSFICVHFSQLVDAPHNTVEHAHAKILVSKRS